MTTRPTPTRRSRARRLAAAVVGGSVAGAAALALASGAVGAGPGEQQEASGGEAMLEADIEAMRESGLPAGHPKVQLLEEELAALQALEGAAPVPEPGVDLAEVAGGGGRQGAQLDATEQWDEGPVECEPLPGHLSAEDLLDATCTVEILVDGMVRYVARTGDGTERDVVFGAVEALPGS